VNTTTIVAAVGTALKSLMAASIMAAIDEAMAVLEPSLTPRSGVIQSYNNGGKIGNDSSNNEGLYNRQSKDNDELFDNEGPNNNGTNDAGGLLDDGLFDNYELEDDGGSLNDG
jgi:hypothetical protein